MREESNVIVQCEEQSLGFLFLSKLEPKVPILLEIRDLCFCLQIAYARLSGVSSSGQGSLRPQRLWLGPKKPARRVATFRKPKMQQFLCNTGIIANYECTLMSLLKTSQANQGCADLQ
jgi:hypothetical protein